MEFGGFEKCTLIDYPGKIACMVYTIGCNFRCPYCHNPELVDETVIHRFSEKEILNFLDTRKKMLDGVVITGGEPTIHGDKLISFMKEVKGRGFLVKLDSNGMNPEFLKKIISEKLVDYIAMDIKSPLEKYSQTVSRPVDIEAIRKSKKIIMESGIEYEFRTTVLKIMLSPEDIEEIGKEIKGAKRYYLQKFIPSKILNPQFLKKTTYNDEEFSALQKNLEKKYVEFCGIR
ncbi:anaerobic ribonucleoside-triphosphate reductase activating protein [Candidatus Gracilibacteria bacterium]|nr:anaerobic ribonucleoside-triphosphate reductase activating protein [Candidatus Gracilibacteria bacterium]MCF7898812.1 anaerobic ribonucleoside-triphosphate reductase activating protein [Candidatus Paceibacterota bacterium]